MNLTGKLMQQMQSWQAKMKVLKAISMKKFNKTSSMRPTEIQIFAKQHHYVAQGFPARPAAAEEEGGNYRQLILLTETKANNDEKSSIEITFSTGGNSACQSGTEERSGFTAVCGTMKAIFVCLLVFVAQIGQKKKRFLHS